MSTPAQLTATERKLVDAIHRGETCDLLRENDVTADMASWGQEHHIRADLLADLLRGKGERWGVGNLPDGLRLRGAVIRGSLSVHEDIELPTVVMESCRFDDGVHFLAPVFSQDASFAGSTFSNTAQFNTTFHLGGRFEFATFYGPAHFQHAVFKNDAMFQHAIFLASWNTFKEGTFEREAWFGHTTFVGSVDFEDATFAQPAHFHGAFATSLKLVSCAIN
jgi:hypothetical protein